MPERPFDKAVPHPFRDAQRRAAHDPTAPTIVTPRPSPRRYAELAVTTNFTFLTGASHPEELVRRAAELGHCATAVADTNTLAGIVRAHVAAKEAGIPLAVGCRLVLNDPLPLQTLVFPTNRPAYARLCRLLTLGKRRAPKGQCHLSFHDLAEHAGGLLAVLLPPRVINDEYLHAAHALRALFSDDDRFSVAASAGYTADDETRLAQISALAEHLRAPIAAVNDVHHHTPERRALQDVLTCIRHRCTLDEAGHRLHASAERHLKPPETMARLFTALPGAPERSADIALRAASFSLDELKYEYPAETCPPGVTPIRHLADLTWAGAARRYPQGVPGPVRDQINSELALIEELRFEAYFLTCHDIVWFARRRNILCQGRGAAANSAVCYALGVTEVNPAEIDLLFARFVSRERGEPPDIDIDFEHERREEVIQHIYRKYGRDRAALTAVVISYRGRSAVREVGKALGLSLDRVDALAKNLDRWAEPPSAKRVRESGLSAEDPTVRRVIRLTREIMGFPRHLSQHVGGFVITRAPLSDLVPIENAAMSDRTVIEWDKDDIDAMGMLKVDVLGLGMLTCVSKGLQMLRHEATKARRHEGEDSDEHDQDIPGFDRVAEGDGLGPFGVPMEPLHARLRAVRPHHADAPRGDLRAFQHRRGLRPAKLGGLHQVPAHLPRIARGTLDADRTLRVARPLPTRPRAPRPPLRSRSRPPRPHPQPQPPILNSSSPPFVPPCLRASVPSLFLLPPHDTLSAILRSPDDPEVYDMVCRADTVGVFQIESRAQMSMLPRLRPRTFYDLVIEVAIVRPGPIQGKMVHPYLRRRSGEEEVVFPNEDIRRVLGKTLGVPLFQEQAMQLAIVAAGFTPDEADRLRRAMAAWKRKGDAIYRFGEKIIAGMTARGYPLEFAERCFEQIKGFSEYGFPESHAASFALIVYASCWLKRYHPAAFAASLINSQPMGFYAPAQIVRDAREHGVTVRPVDVNASGWDCSLEERDEETVGGRDGETERRRDEVGEKKQSHEQWGSDGPAMRLGMRLVKGLGEEEARRIENAVRDRGPFDSIESLWRASGASVRALRCLARADAFNSMNLDRQHALWAVRALRDERLPLFEQTDSSPPSSSPALPPFSQERHVLHDYATCGLSLRAHPVSFIRDSLDQRRALRAEELRDPERCPTGRWVSVAGVVLVRQRPSTASGVVFITLEDETGIANLVIWPKTFERFRRAGRLASVLLATGRVERQGEVVHLHARRLISLDDYMPDFDSTSRDFH